VDRDSRTYLRVWEEFLDAVPFLSYAPYFTLSAVTKQRSGRLLEMVWQVHEARQLRIETGELNRFFEGIVRQQPPRTHEGHQGKIYYAVQAEKAPPTFVVSVNDPGWFARHYLRYLNNKLREAYGFTGNRIFIKLKEH